MESERDTTQSTENIVEQTSAKKQAEIHSTSTQPIKPLVIDLDEEWEKFNKNIHAEEQFLELQTPQHRTTQEIAVEKTVNTQEVEHILVTPISEIVLTIIILDKQLAETIVKDISHKKLFMYSAQYIDHHHTKVQ